MEHFEWLFSVNKYDDGSLNDLGYYLVNAAENEKAGYNSFK